VIGEACVTRAIAGDRFRNGAQHACYDRIDVQGMNSKDIICIVGMHRAGTSTVSRLTPRTKAAMTVSAGNARLA